MLARYHRWMYENSEDESVETLRQWVIKEAEFQTIAAETVRGLLPKKEGVRTHFGQNQSQQQVGDLKKSCKVCDGQHGPWRCDEFKKMSVSSRWETAKRLKLCYRCLNDNHMGQDCTRSRVCGLNGCTETHSRLLHRNRNTEPRSRPLGEQVNSRGAAPPTEGEQRKSVNKLSNTDEEVERTTVTMTANADGRAGYVALRMVPIILRNGKNSVKVNAVLDDASTKTYVNADIAAQLGIHGQAQRVNVNVLNGQVETFETVPVEFGLESVNGKVKTTISAFTTNRVTGDMKVINWAKQSKKWNHLKGIQFPTM